MESRKFPNIAESPLDSAFKVKNAINPIIFRGLFFE